MASIMLVGVQRDMLETVLAYGGAATLDQMRNFRRKSAAHAKAVELFSQYGLTKTVGCGYVITPVGLLAASRGSYDTGWDEAPPTLTECLDGAAEALAGRMATAATLFGPDFGKFLTQKAGAFRKAAPHPSGRCTGCQKFTPMSELSGEECAWKCTACRAPGQ